MAYNQIEDIWKYLRHPEKYTGERPITMRSGWEIKFVTKYLDINADIVEWKSEVPIQYVCGTDGRKHRYFVDFWFKAKTKDGAVKEFLIEIKPEKDKVQPEKPTRANAAFYRRMHTYIKNQSKWKAAEQLCESAKINGRNIEFVILTEKDCPWFTK